MAATFCSDQQLIQDPDQAQKASLNGPVFITGNGEITHVLLSITDYQRLADALPQPDAVLKDADLAEDH